MTKDIWTDIKTTIDLDPAAIIIKMVIILLVILATRLFMYLLTKMTTKIINDSKEIEDEEKWAKQADTAINRKWWDFMADIMETNPDNSPVSVDLHPVFHLD